MKEDDEEIFDDLAADEEVSLTRPFRSPTPWLRLSLSLSHFNLPKNLVGVLRGDWRGDESPSAPENSREIRSEDLRKRPEILALFWRPDFEWARLSSLTLSKLPRLFARL